jgi:hypothetical protein
MRLGHKRLAVENRRQQIIRQLERLRSQLAKRCLSNYANEKAYKRQLKRSHELISDLEGELLILDCPGEYDELPAAVVADELGLTYEQIRNLIKLGEIAATGKTAHERVCRMELERIITVGVPTLLRLGKEEPADIFERAIPHLQNGDLEAAKRVYQRLEARQGWRGPYAPAFLVGLELASGDLDGAVLSMSLIHEYEDPLGRIVIMNCLGRLLQGMRLTERNAQELCARFILVSEGITGTLAPSKDSVKSPKQRTLNKPQ